MTSFLFSDPSQLWDKDPKKKSHKFCGTINQGTLSIFWDTKSHEKCPPTEVATVSKAPASSLIPLSPALCLWAHLSLILLRQKFFLWEFKSSFINNEFTAIDPADLLIQLIICFNLLYFHIYLSMYTFFESINSVKKGKILHRIQYLVNDNYFYLTRLIFRCTFLWKVIIFWQT